MTADAPTASAPTRHSVGDGIRLVLRGLGQTLITVGVVLLLFVVYSLYITNLFAAADQRGLSKDLDTVFAQTPAATGGDGETAQPALPDLGDALARIYIPKIGVERVIVEGVAVSDLKKGPGHYPGTALPGEIGNAAIAGHRTTYGEPFNRLDELKNGDPIVIETATAFYTYTMSSDQIVKPTQTDVTFPVPGDATAAPTIAQVTLTTCNPKYSAKTRLIVHGVLSDTTLKSGGQRPVALRGV